MEIETTKRLVDAAARYEVCVKHTKKDAVPLQHARRERYLSRNLARAKANLLVKEATEAGVVSTPTESLAQLSQERIIGTSDLFDINYLELAIAVGRAVARIEIGQAHATGFLVGPGLLITNNLVL
jgi:hypothetical protein